MSGSPYLCVSGSCVISGWLFVKSMRVCGCLLCGVSVVVGIVSG